MKTQESDFPILEAAIIAHYVNKAICEAQGDYSQKDWQYAEDWQRQRAINGVKFAVQNPNASPREQHEAWVQDKLADNWAYGPVKNAEKKKHPCLVPYDELPFEQKVKDYAFRGAVKAAEHLFV